MNELNGTDCLGSLPLGPVQITSQSGHQEDPALLTRHIARPKAALINSGSGSVDFQEFVGGLSAFSSKGGREEKLRCELCLTLVDLVLIKLPRALVVSPIAEGTRQVAQVVSIQ